MRNVRRCVYCCSDCDIKLARKCFEGKDRPFFRGRLRPLTLREEYAKRKFVKRWRKKNKTWKECRQKRRRLADAVRKAGFEKACRQRWRALNLVIKAKLEAVECGISVFDDEFMSNIVLPGGQTVSDFMKPQIEQAYICGTVPKMLPILEG